MVLLIISADFTNSSASITIFLGLSAEERLSRLPSRRDQERFDCVLERDRERDLDSCDEERERLVETSLRLTFSGGLSCVGDLEREDLLRFLSSRDFTRGERERDLLSDLVYDLDRDLERERFE